MGVLIYMEPLIATLNAIMSPRQMNVAKAVRDYWREYCDPFPYRAYMKKKKCIFIHIPKCAGTSVRKALGASSATRDHIDAKIYLKANPTRFGRYYKFTFVRNPWDRLVSVYEYWKGGGNGTTDLYYQKLVRKLGSFENFVLCFLDEDVLYANLLLRPQYLFIYDYKNELMVDYVGRFETLQSSYAVVADSLRIDRQLDVANKSNRMAFKDYYRSVEVKSRVASLYKKDLTLLGYRFDNE